MSGAGFIRTLEQNLERAESFQEYMRISRLLDLELYRKECRQAFRNVRLIKNKRATRISNNHGKPQKVNLETMRNQSLVSLPSPTELRNFQIRLSDEFTDPGLYYPGQDIYN